MSSEDFLKDIQIASPCPMKWDDMARTGEDAKRFCGDCRKHVFSIDKMSANEAQTLIQNAYAKDSSVCLRLFRRADGTIITDDCPVGLRRVRDMWRKFKSIAASAMLLLGVLPAMGDEKDDCKSQELLGRSVRRTPTSNKPTTAAFPVSVTMGEPMMLDYGAEANKVPTIKAFADRIKSLEKNSNQTKKDKVEIVKLRLAMAQEAMHKDLSMFALQELSNDLTLAKALPDSSVGDKSEKNALLKNLLTEKLACLTRLKRADSERLRKQLDALSKAK